MLGEIIADYPFARTGPRQTRSLTPDSGALRRRNWREIYRLDDLRVIWGCWQSVREKKVPRRTCHDRLCTPNLGRKG